MRGRAGSSGDLRRDVSAWARDALASLTARPGVLRAGLAVPEGGGRRLRFTASGQADDDGVEWCYIDAYDDVPLTTTVRTGTPVIGDLDQLAGRYADFVERQRGTSTVAVAAVPVVSSGRPVGGFVLFFDEAQGFGTVQRLELARVGEDLGARLRHAQQSDVHSPSDMSAEATMAGSMVAVHTVAADPVAVSESRTFLRRTLEAWDIDDEVAATAVLCLSELVTNAVIHARTGCGVRVVLDQNILTVTVRDGGSTKVASTVPVDDPLQGYGRGLHLVESLVTRWGSERDSAGTSVWFVLEL